MGTLTRQQELQDAQYELPYHHLPRLYHWRDKIEYEVYLRWVIKEIRRIKPRNLLDVGCGDGRLISDLGFGSGVDLSWKAVRWARALDLDCYHKDGKYVWGEFELVTAIEVMEHVPEREIKEFVEMLAARTREWVIVMVPTINCKLNPKHYRHYTQELLKKHLGDRFYGRFEWIVRRPWWWTLLEGIPVHWFEGFLYRWMWKNIKASPRNGRHLVFVGRVK